MPKKSTCNNRNPNPPCLDGYYEKKNPKNDKKFLLLIFILSLSLVRKIATKTPIINCQALVGVK